MNGAEPLSLRAARRWALLYTRGLPDGERERRRLELESDMWEHLHDPHEPHAARDIFGRFLRGIPADVRWRYRTLLEARGARQRRHAMSTSPPRNWWVILTAILGTLILTGGLFQLMIGASDDAPVAMMLIGTIGSAVAGGLVLGGLVRRRHDLLSGSQLILAGSLMTLLGIELLPLGLIVLISGFWTGNLQLSSREDEPELAPVRRQQVDMTRRWYLWLVAAAALGAIGFLVLLIWPSVTPDNCTEFNPCWEDTAAWATWILSWLAAIVTGGIGVILGGLRLLVRHRTRFA